MLRRTIGITAVAAAVSFAALLPAGAQTAPSAVEKYAAGSKATALDLTVFGQKLTIANTAAGITGVQNLDGTPKIGQAIADGVALLTPLFKSDGASANSSGPTSAEDCTPIELPSPINLVTTNIVCVTTSAVLANGMPVSSALSNQIVIELRAGDLVATTPLADVVGQIQTGLDGLFDQLVDLVAPIQDATKIQLTDIVDGLLSEVSAGDLLARITVAPTSSTGAYGSGVAANAVSDGVIVELLPNLPGGALAVATVGTATAGVVRDALTGVPTLTGSAATLNVTYPNGLLGGLSVLTDALGQVVNVTSEQLTCNDSNPLAGVLCFTLGTTKDLDAVQAKSLGFDYGPNTVGRESSVLGLQLLGLAPEGGIVMNIGHTAAASGSAAPLPAPGAPELPATGGGTPYVLTLALLGLAAGAATMLRRTRTI